jgi:hypothetical protein
MRGVYACFQDAANDMRHCGATLSVGSFAQLALASGFNPGSE